MRNSHFEYKNEAAYPSSSVLGEGNAALMVCRTSHHPTPCAGIAVGGSKLLREPLVHLSFPGVGLRPAPPGNHLHVIKYLAYKIK
jgi:hypothetical protein